MWFSLGCDFLIIYGEQRAHHSKKSLSNSCWPFSYVAKGIHIWTSLIYFLLWFFYLETPASVLSFSKKSYFDFLPKCFVYSSLLQVFLLFIYLEIFFAFLFHPRYLSQDVWCGKIFWGIKGEHRFTLILKRFFAASCAFDII